MVSEQNEGQVDQQLQAYHWASGGGAKLELLRQVEGGSRTVHKAVRCQPLPLEPSVLWGGAADVRGWEASGGDRPPLPRSPGGSFAGSATVDQ